MKNIAVEKGLENVVEYLSKEGYSVQMLSESIDDNISTLNNYDAIVTAGYNTDMMGISDTSTLAPVVNARGLTPEEIKANLEKQLH